MKKQKPGYVLFFWIGIVFSLFALSIFYYTGSDSPLIPFAVSVAVLYFAFAEADKMKPLKESEADQSKKKRLLHPWLFIFLPTVFYAVYTIWQEFICLEVISGPQCDAFSQIIAPILFSYLSSLGFCHSSKAKQQEKM